MPLPDLVNLNKKDLIKKNLDLMKPIHKTIYLIWQMGYIIKFDKYKLIETYITAVHANDDNVI